MMWTHRQRNRHLGPLLVLLLVAATRHAPAITVTTSADSGPGSLREALVEGLANAGPDTIDFDPALSGTTITLTDGPLQATDIEGVTVDASALTAGVTISGNSSDRVFYNHTDGNLTLRALTLTGGYQDLCCGGAAVLNQGNTVTLDRCTLTGNAAGYGPAVFTDTGRTTTLLQCTLSANHATVLGGAVFNRGTTTLIHCTVAGNSSDGNAGAIYNESGTALTLENCAIGDNSASATDDVQNEGTLTIAGANLVESEILHGIDATVDGSGTVTNAAPILATLDNYGGPTTTMLPLPGSPAIDAAVGSTETNDQRGVSRPRDGDTNSTAVADLGAVEVGDAPAPPSADLTNLVLSVGTLTPAFDDTTTTYWVGDVAATVTNITLTPTASDTNATVTVNDLPVLTGNPSGSIALQLGDNVIVVVVTAAGGGATTTYTVNIQLTKVRYVWPGSPNPALPFGGWNNAAHDIQTAIDAAVAGDTVLVTNGTYATGGRVQFGAMTNRVVIDKAITVISVNGPAMTTILGAKDPVATNGNAAVRCVYVGANAIISGFTLAGGATRDRGDAAHEQYGGGAWCEASALVSNCILSGNSSWFGGAGAFDGTLSHCVLIGNSADEGSGGGAYSATLNDCVLTSNSAYYGGGSFAADANRCIFSGNRAVYGGAKVNGTLNNCLVIGNSASQQGGGTGTAGLNNCTVTGNSAPVNGGVDGYLLRNCIVYFNLAASNANYGGGGSMSTSCTTPDPGGTGNITNDPQFVASNDFHLVIGSPCADMGDNNYAPAGTDLDGHTRVNNDIVDMGAYELPPQNIAVLSTNGALIASGDESPSLSDSTDFGLVHVLAGVATRAFVVTNTGGATLTLAGVTFAGSNAADFAVLDLPASIGVGGATNLVVRCTPTATGLRTATISITNNSFASSVYTFTLSALVTNGPATRYVWTNSPSPMVPYTNWQTAAHTIQDAVDFAYVGDHVIVTNGVYATGGRVIAGAMTNRVAIDKVITVESVNGPVVTIIQGAGPNGNAAVRCVYLKGGATLSGFTLSGGATRSAGASDTEQSGGGVWCPGFFAVVSNCVFSGNSAASGGGGAYGVYARFNDCTFSGNSATFGGGVLDSSGCVFINCTLTANTASQQGGGASGGTHYNGTFTGNTAAQRGGGNYGGLLVKCRLIGNRTTQSGAYGGALALGNMDGCLVVSNSSYQGGGAYYGTLRNSTLIGNSAGLWGGGSFRSTVHNCVVVGNTDTFGAPNVYVDNAFGGGGSIDYSCTTPLMGGAGNISNDPMLDATNGFRLLAGSPCRDSGNNGFIPAGGDLDSNPRIVNVAVDMGAYEFQSGPPADYDADQIPSWWETQKGLSTVVSNDASSDADWMTDLQEYVADTDPNNAASYFPPAAFTNATPGTLRLIIDPTSTARIYRVSATTNLLSVPHVWQPMAPEQTGTAGTIVFTVTNSVPIRFYRTGVRLP